MSFRTKKYLTIVDIENTKKSGVSVSVVVVLGISFLGILSYAKKQHLLCFKDY
jgi:uncharacterized membrane protein YqhA